MKLKTYGLGQQEISDLGGKVLESEDTLIHISDFNDEAFENLDTKWGIAGIFWHPIDFKESNARE